MIICYITLIDNTQAELLLRVGWRRRNAYVSILVSERPLTLKEITMPHMSTMEARRYWYNKGSLKLEHHVNMSN